MTPKRTSAALIMLASTGRRIAVSDSFMTGNPFSVYNAGQPLPVRGGGYLIVVRRTQDSTSAPRPRGRKTSRPKSNRGDGFLAAANCKECVTSASLTAALAGEFLRVAPRGARSAQGRAEAQVEDHQVRLTANRPHGEGPVAVVGNPTARHVGRLAVMERADTHIQRQSPAHPRPAPQPDAQPAADFRGPGEIVVQRRGDPARAAVVETEIRREVRKASGHEAVQADRA